MRYQQLDLLPWWNLKQRHLILVGALGGWMAGCPLAAGGSVVTNLGDSGPGSLRQVLATSTSGSTITFATNGTITLTSGELFINTSASIVGPGATNLVISGNHTSRVFRIGQSGGAEVGPMNGPHDGHTATLLNDGTVLVAGGPGYVFPVGSPELFNPAGNTWTSTALPMPLPRFGHTATLLHDGSLLVAGGADPANINFDSTSAWVYSSGTWTPANPLIVARFNHTSTLLPSGIVLVAGGAGSNGPLTSVEAYTPISGTATNPLAVARESHTATLLSNGQVLVVGGNGVSGPLASVELFNPTNGAWRATNSLATARESHTATLLTNGMVLVVGGAGSSGLLASVELFNPADGSWTAVNPLIAARCHHTATLLANGKVLVAGGAGPAGPLSSVELFDPVTRTWTTASPLTIARESHTATLLNDGTVLVAGGTGSSGPLTSAEIYGPGAQISVNISGLTIRDGRAPDGGQTVSQGGGIYNAATLTLTDCTLDGNTAGNGFPATNGVSLAGSGGDGGAIHNSGTLTLTACTLSGNRAGTGGDGVGCVFGSAAFSELHAGEGGNGGAINNVGTLILTTCTLSGNQAGSAGNNASVGNGSDGIRGGHGGAIFNDGRLSVTSSTVSGNVAGTGGSGGNGGTGGTGGSGGAIFSSSGGTPATLRNGLFALNNAGAAGADGGGGPGTAGYGPDLLGTFTSLGHNLLSKTDNSTGLTNDVSGDQVGTAAAPINPLLGPLQANGGPTFTMALSLASPATDAGDDSLAGTDQRGHPRLSGLHVDIGAYELDSVTGFLAPAIADLSAGVATNDPSTRLWSLPVNASVNPGGLPTAVFLAYGPTANYGSSTAPVPAGYGTAYAPVSLALSGLMPGTTYHYRLVAVNAVGTATTLDQTMNAGLLGDFNGDGVVSQNELDAVYANYLPTSPWLYLTNTAGLGGTNVTFTLPNSPAGAYHVQYSTDLVTWDLLGPATPRYEFTDTNAPALPQRFYRLVWP